MKTHFIGPLLLTLIATVVLCAQAPSLSVRMGLWEVASTINIGGEMPAIDTSKMTPQQKAQMEAAMKGMMGSHTNTNKSCMTKEKFNADEFMGRQDDKNCKQAITTNTSSALEVTVTCTGENAMTATMHLDALSATSVKGTIKSTMTEQGRPMMMNGTLTGKWLGADCGDTK